MRKKKRSSDAPRMRTIKETAELTGVTEYRIRILCKRGEIAAIKNGNRFLVNLDRFIDYLNGRSVL